MLKLCGAKWPHEENGKLAPDDAVHGTSIWRNWWRNGQIRDPSDDEIWAPWWPDGEIGGTICPTTNSLKRFHAGPLHSFKLMGPKFSLRDFRCHQIWKRIQGTLILHCSFRPIFQRLCNDYQCLILAFSVIYLESRGYIGWGHPSGYLKSFVLSFLFFSSFFLSILHFLFFLSFSRGPL